MSDRRSATACLLLCTVLLCLGCGDEAALDVEKGQYQVSIEGSLTDTLAGPAVYRLQEEKRVRIELGTRKGPGLSIELEPRLPHSERGGEEGSVPRPGRYDVVAASLLDRPHPDSLTGLIAFLSVADAQFAATQGHFSITHVADGTVTGTLDLTMEERPDDSLPERAVRVTGALRATRP
ncbi:MAG: hypothetical protein ABEL04_03550 [Salinibacter sp.]|uniref:hypothetical protein n=1 Tax=Salinibacter sp. TaxID=2065818 RepID=UPI0035D4DB34